MSPLPALLLLVCCCCCCLLPVTNAQDELQDLEALEKQPFLLKSGAPYRDRLTIGAATAVAEFASRKQEQDQPKIMEKRREARRTGADRPSATQFYSHTLDQPVGRPNPNTDIEFSISRHIRIPPELEQDRIVADHNEAVLLAERDAENLIPDLGKVKPSAALQLQQQQLQQQPPATTSSLSRPRTSSLGLRPSAELGFSGSRYAAGYGAPPPPYSPAYEQPPPYKPPAYKPPAYSAPAYEPPPPYSAPPPAYEPLSFPRHRLSAGPPANSFRQSPLLPGRPTVDYGFEVSHGAGGGSYSYSTFT